MGRKARSNRLERLKTTQFSGSQPGAIFSPRGHLAMSGDIFIVLSGGAAVKNPPDNAGDAVQSAGREDPLEKEMANPLQHSCLENPRGCLWLAQMGRLGNGALDIKLVKARDADKQSIFLRTAPQQRIIQPKISMPQLRKPPPPPHPTARRSRNMNDSRNSQPLFFHTKGKNPFFSLVNGRLSQTASKTALNKFDYKDSRAASPFSRNVGCTELVPREPERTLLPPSG